MINTCSSPWELVITCLIRNKEKKPSLINFTATNIDCESILISKKKVSNNLIKPQAERKLKTQKLRNNSENSKSSEKSNKDLQKPVGRKL